MSKTLEQEVSVWPNFLLRTEYPIPSQAFTCGLHVGHSSTGSCFLQLLSVYSRHYHSINAPFSKLLSPTTDFVQYQRMGPPLNKTTLCFQIQNSTTTPFLSRYACA